jgi:hypothetical protein
LAAKRHIRVEEKSKPPEAVLHYKIDGIGGFEVLCGREIGAIEVDGVITNGKNACE